MKQVDATLSRNLDLPDAPVGIPADFESHLKLMFDLQVLAYKSEVTRISTLMFARENSNAVYAATGVRDGFHNASHHSNERRNMDQFAVINRYHVKMLGYFLERLRTTPDGDGNLLDHSMILYGSSLSDGNEHNFDPLPVLIAGGASGGSTAGGTCVTRRTRRCRTCCWRCSRRWARGWTRSATAPRPSRCRAALPPTVYVGAAFRRPAFVGAGLQTCPKNSSTASGSSG